MIIANNNNCNFFCVSGKAEQQPSPSEGGGHNWWKRRWKLNTVEVEDKNVVGTTSTTTNTTMKTMTTIQGNNDYCRNYCCGLSSSTSALTSGKSDLINNNKRLISCVNYNKSRTCSSNYHLNDDFHKNVTNNAWHKKSAFSTFFDTRRQFLSLKNLLYPSSVTFLNFLVIFIIAFLTPNNIVDAFPTTSDCDWTGSGTPENVVQAIYLRCQQGQIIWERPRGGLRVNISPPNYNFRTSENQPFRLCLESNVGSNFQVFLEQTGSERDRKLLPFISPESTTCYRISTPTATLYVESQNQYDGGTSSVPTTASLYKQETFQVKISYEIEESKSQGEFTDDECRPCSDQEVLQLYCIADVVARGEILSVLPSSSNKKMDNLHIKSDLVIHQNHPVFQPLKPGNRNLQKFLSQEIRTFDQNSPKKMPKSSKSSIFGGIISHPVKCAAQSGPGQFLWLIKLSFGRPKIGCVVYWDRWVSLAQDASQSDSASCPLIYQ